MKRYPKPKDEVTSGPVKKAECLFPTTSMYLDLRIEYCRLPVALPTTPTMCFAHYALVYEDKINA